jgi:hypothetical protein
MFEYFSKRSRPDRAEVRHVEFVTASPSVSSECHWATIEAQEKQFNLSSVNITHDPQKRSFAGKTENVARLTLDLGHLKPGPIQIALDGETLANVEWPGDIGKLWLYRGADKKWRTGPRPAATEKYPARSGPFREAFRNRVLFVVGTKGTDAENAWALQKARLDAESFWYRGNGFIEIVLDTEFGASHDRDRNVVLYGNADTNAVWTTLLDASPVVVRRGVVTIGSREAKGEDLACLFVRPRPGSDIALVGVVSGAGIKGMRLTDRLPYFVSGVGYPDCVLFRPEALAKGLSGITAAGFFGNDWSVENGEFAWR